MCKQMTKAITIDFLRYLYFTSVLVLFYFLYSRLFNIGEKLIIFHESPVQYASASCCGNQNI